MVKIKVIKIIKQIIVQTKSWFRQNHVTNMVLRHPRYKRGREGACPGVIYYPPIQCQKNTSKIGEKKEAPPPLLTSGFMDESIAPLLRRQTK